MHYILSIVEQLDKAATELGFEHSINDRLALILIDNVVELTMARRIRDTILDFDDWRGRIGPDVRTKARSQNINRRLEALITAQQLDTRSADFIGEAHKHRNRLYHEGQGTEPYIRALAFTYYQFACELFERFGASTQVIIGDRELSEIGLRYARLGRKSIALELPLITNELRVRLPPLPAISLQDQIADYAEEQRMRIADAFRFLIQDNLPGYKAPEVLRLAQLHWDQRQALIKAGLEDVSWMSPVHAEAIALLRKHDKGWQPKYRAIPHPRWAVWARKVRAEPDPLTAFARFGKLLDDTRYLDGAITESAMGLDANIQLEIDRARGK